MPSMTSRLRATKEIHHEPDDPAQPLQLQLHELPRNVVYLRLPKACRRGRHYSRLRVRPAVPMRPGVHLPHLVTALT